MTRPVRLTAEQRINRIRQRLTNGQAGFQVGDVAALMDEYDRVTAELAELAARVGVDGPTVIAVPAVTAVQAGTCPQCGRNFAWYDHLRQPEYVGFRRVVDGRAYCSFYCAEQAEADRIAATKGGA